MKQAKKNTQRNIIKYLKMIHAERLRKCVLEGVVVR